MREGRPPSRTARVLRGVALFSVAVLAGVGAAWFVLPRVLGGAALHGTELPQPEPAPPLDGLVTATGAPVDLAADRGKVVVLFFGYGSCPDVCPTSLARISRAIDQLGDDGSDVVAYFVSVDPARDTPELLARYTSHFSDQIVGVTGSEAAIAEAAARYGIFYDLHEPEPDGSYVVDHTASFTGIDADGRLRVVWPAEIDVDDLAADLRHLR